MTFGEAERAAADLKRAKSENPAAFERKKELRKAASISRSTRDKSHAPVNAVTGETYFDKKKRLALSESYSGGVPDSSPPYPGLGSHAARPRSRGRSRSKSRPKSKSGRARFAPPNQLAEQFPPSKEKDIFTDASTETQGYCHGVRNDLVSFRLAETDDSTLASSFPNVQVAAATYL